MRDIAFLNIFCAILFYQDYRNHAKSNGNPLLFLVLRDYCPRLFFLELYLHNLYYATKSQTIQGILLFVIDNMGIQVGNLCACMSKLMTY